MGAVGLGYQHPRVSPDGTHVAVSMLDGEGNRDIYVYDVDRLTPTRLTFDPAEERDPVVDRKWARGGLQIKSRGRGDIQEESGRDWRH